MYSTHTCTTYSTSYIKTLIRCQIQYIHLVFLTWYQSHCSEFFGVQFAVLSSQCSPLPSSLTLPLESLSSLYTEDHYHFNHRHTFYYDPLFAGSIEIVFFRSTSSKKNQRHQTYHAPSCAAQVNCIKDMRHMCLHASLEDSTSSSTCHTQPRAHAPTCLTRPMRPCDSRALHASHALHVPRSSSNLLTSSVMSSCLRQPPWQPSAYVIIRVI